MRLTELHPELHTEGCEQGEAYLYLDCPHCQASHYIQIKIAAPPASASNHVWNWNGETDFEKLTLTPSLRCDRHWHGYITNGEIITLNE